MKRRVSRFIGRGAAAILSLGVVTALLRARANSTPTAIHEEELLRVDARPTLQMKSGDEPPPDSTAPDDATVGSSDDAANPAGLYAFIAALLFVATLYMIAPIEFIWSVRLLDSVIIAAAVAALLTLTALATMLAFPGRAFSRAMGSVIGRVDTLTIVTGVAAVLALFAAYGSFRNQTRLTSEGQMNTDAMILYELEMKHPELRCLYDNYGFPQHDECLAQITSDGGNWSLAIFYVEESWFVLTQSYEDRKNWGSTYADMIEYWRDDVEKDPTGFFTYYQVASTDPRLSDRERLESAEAEIKAAGIVIPREEMCRRYIRVRLALERRSAQSDDRNVCKLP